MAGEVAAANSLPLATVGSGPRREHAITIYNGSFESEKCFPLSFYASYIFFFTINNLRHQTHHKHHEHKHHEFETNWIPHRHTGKILEQTHSILEIDWHCEFSSVYNRIYNTSCIRNSPNKVPEKWRRRFGL